MQANIRGFLSRKDIKKGNELADAKPQVSSRSRNKLPGGRIDNAGRVLNHKELSELPDYMNPLTKATEARLGDFQFEWPEGQAPSSQLVEKGPIELSNGAIYHGQWN